MTRGNNPQLPGKIQSLFLQRLSPAQKVDNISHNLRGLIQFFLRVVKRRGNTGYRVQTEMLDYGLRTHTAGTDCHTVLIQKACQIIWVYIFHLNGEDAGAMFRCTKYSDAFQAVHYPPCNTADIETTEMLADVILKKVYP